MTFASSLLRRLSILLALALALSVLAQAVPPASAEEPWLAFLRHQIKSSHNCDIEHLVFSREVPVGNETTIEGRLRCRDGREYDFTRARPHQKFDVRLCQPTVC